MTSSAIVMSPRSAATLLPLLLLATMMMLAMLPVPTGAAGGGGSGGALAAQQAEVAEAASGADSDDIDPLPSAFALPNGRRGPRLLASRSRARLQQHLEQRGGGGVGTDSHVVAAAQDGRLPDFFQGVVDVGKKVVQAGKRVGAFVVDKVGDWTNDKIVEEMEKLVDRNAEVPFKLWQMVIEFFNGRFKHTDALTLAISQTQCAPHWADNNWAKHSVGVVTQLCNTCWLEAVVSAVEMAARARFGHDKVPALAMEQRMGSPLVRVTDYRHAVRPCSEEQNNVECDKQARMEHALLVALESSPLIITVDATNWGVVGKHTTPFANKGFCSTRLDKQNHAAVIVGVNLKAPKPYWIVQNSYGPDWGNGGMIFLEFGANTCGLANGAFRFDLVKQLNPGPVPVMQAAASSKVCNGRQLSEQTLSVIKRGISDGTIGKSKVTAKSTAFRFLQVSQQFSVLDAIIGHIFEKQTDDYDRMSSDVPSQMDVFHAYVLMVKWNSAIRRTNDETAVLVASVADRLVLFFHEQGCTRYTRPLALYTLWWTDPMGRRTALGKWNEDIFCDDRRRIADFCNNASKKNGLTLRAIQGLSEGLFSRKKNK